jgi:hypothetical protein
MQTSTVCAIHRWLDKGKEDGLIERELFPSQSIVGGINWKMTIITGRAGEGRALIGQREEEEHAELWRCVAAEA